jgi:hypothetical protein
MGLLEQPLSDQRQNNGRDPNSMLDRERPLDDGTAPLSPAIEMA